MSSSEAAPSAAQGRGLVAAAAVLFAVSTAFPVAASVLELERPPRWAGVADAIVALVVVGLGIAVASKKPAGFDARASRSALHVYRSASHLLLVLLVVFLTMGDRIEWDVLLVGLAWRAWLFAWVLPSALALWHAAPPANAGGDAAPPRVMKREDS